MMNSPNRFRKLVFYILGALPWMLLFALLGWYKSIVRQSMDPSLYKGICYKSNGLAVKCSLEQWQLWDASPIIDMATFVGSILAAAISGYVYLLYLRDANQTQN